MDYNISDKININNKEYIISKIYNNHVEIESNEFKLGLIDKKTSEIILEPIYDSIYMCNNCYIIGLNVKLGLADKITGKVFLKPILDITVNFDFQEDYEDLLKIYKQKLLLQEKLKQLKEDLSNDL